MFEVVCLLGDINNKLCEVDLFFYREPEESKEQEEEDLPTLPDYAVDYASGGGADWSTAQIPEGQWAPDLAGPIPAVASGWTAAAPGVAAVDGDGWDAAAAPTVVPPC
ncbi:hypothetical protein ACS0TY_004042 [Phlomoides rotata]